MITSRDLELTSFLFCLSHETAILEGREYVRMLGLPATETNTGLLKKKQKGSGEFGRAGRIPIKIKHWVQKGVRSPRDPGIRDTGRVFLGTIDNKTPCHLHVTLLDIQIPGGKSWTMEGQAHLDDSPTKALSIGWDCPPNKIKVVTPKEWGVGTEQTKLGYHTSLRNPGTSLNGWHIVGAQEILVY